jgi:hypothetical protein
VELNWSGSLAVSESRGATGDAVLPTTSPVGLAGTHLCASGGSQIAMVKEGVRFRLASMTKGTNCDQPVSGELKGCWSPR